jgi:hypothetical protein
MSAASDGLGGQRGRKRNEDEEERHDEEGGSAKEDEGKRLAVRLHARFDAPGLADVSLGSPGATSNGKIPDRRRVVAIRTAVL